MVKLTFYGGVNEIGGNKILVEDRKTRVFFDFGLSFKKGQEFYTGFLTARKVSGAADDLELGILPRIEGLYSKEALRFTDLKYQEPKFDAIFISHAHMDHFAHLQYIDESIPVYLGECTLKVIESFQPGEREQEAFGKHPYKTFRTGKKINVGDITVEPYSVDHSVPGAYAFLIHTSDGTIVYTGDFRAHGPAADLTRRTVEKAKECEPIALITEGTRLGRKESKGEKLTEEGVREIANRIVSKSKRLVINTFYGRDIDRIRTFYKVAEDNDRKFVVSMRTAHLMNKLKDDPRLDVPDPLKDENILIYARRKKSGEYTEKDYYIWERPYLDNSIGFKHIQENCSNYLLNLDLYNFSELIDIKPEGGEFIHSMSEPFSEGGMDQIEQDIMVNWLRHFGLKLYQAHASGHVDVRQLKKIAEYIKPKKLFPIHTDRAEMFKKLIGKKVKVIQPEIGKTIVIE